MILGLYALISPLPFKREFVNRQGLIQVASGFLLVVSCTPFLAVDAIFTDVGIGFSSKGMLNRPFGLALLAVYLLVTYLSYQA